jgi:hypothetical protein
LFSPRRIAELSLVAAMLHAPLAWAGWYVQPAVRWVSLTHRPEANEPTPNYYGYGTLLSGGYSAKQVFDLGIFGAYTPANYKNATFPSGNAELTNYGGEVALRLGESVYIGLRGGQGTYHLLSTATPDELPGKWSGPAGELAIGGVMKLTKNSFCQVSLDFMHGVFKQTEPGAAEIEGRRRFDGVAVTFSYVYNHYKSYLIDNTIFGNFLDSLMF